MSFYIISLKVVIYYVHYVYAVGKINNMFLMMWLIIMEKALIVPRLRLTTAHSLYAAGLATISFLQMIYTRKKDRSILYECKKYIESIITLKWKIMKHQKENYISAMVLKSDSDFRFLFKLLYMSYNNTLKCLFTFELCLIQDL